MAESTEDSIADAPRCARSRDRRHRAALYRADGLPPADRAAAVRSVRAFVDALGASGFGPYSDVLVYGSRVRGDWDEYSDIDVAVVVPGMLDSGEMLRRLDDLTLRTIDVCDDYWHLSVTVVPEAALAHPSAQANPAYYRNIRDEGIPWSAFCGR